MGNRLFFPAVLLIVMLQAALVRSQQLTVQNETGKQTLLARLYHPRPFEAGPPLG